MSELNMSFLTALEECEKMQSMLISTMKNISENNIRCDVKELLEQVTKIQDSVTNLEFADIYESQFDESQWLVDEAPTNPRVGNIYQICGFKWECKIANDDYCVCIGEEITKTNDNTYTYTSISAKGLNAYLYNDFLSALKTFLMDPDALYFDEVRYKIIHLQGDTIVFRPVIIFNQSFIDRMPVVLV